MGTVIMLTLSGRDRVRTSLRGLCLLQCSVFMIAVACSGADSAAVKPEISSVTVGLTSVSIVPGGAATILYSIERSSTFFGAVNLQVVNLPLGLTATFAPASLGPNDNISQLTITATSAAPAGTYSLVTKVSGDGVEAKTITISTTVNAPAIALSLGTTTPTITQGSTQTIPVTITRLGGFSGIVGLSVLGLPAGVSGVFTPVVIVDGEATSTLTLTSSLATPVSTNSISIRAAATGVAEQSVSAQLTVVPTTTPAISATATALALPQTLSGQSTVTITRYAGFNGPVDLSVENLPANVTVDAPQIASGATSSTLTFFAGLPATPQMVTLNVRASGPGIQSVVVPLPLQILLMPEFRFSFPPTGPGGGPTATWGGSVVQGATAFVGASVIRISSFAELVTLTLTDLPPGASTTIPASAGAATSINFSIATSPSTPVGVYVMTLRGVAAGGMTRETTLTLNVVAPGN